MKKDNLSYYSLFGMSFFSHDQLRLFQQQQQQAQQAQRSSQDSGGGRQQSNNSGGGQQKNSSNGSDFHSNQGMNSMFMSGVGGGLGSSSSELLFLQQQQQQAAAAAQRQQFAAFGGSMMNSSSMGMDSSLSVGLYGGGMLPGGMGFGANHLALAGASGMGMGSAADQLSLLQSQNGFPFSSLGGNGQGPGRSGASGQIRGMGGASGLCQSDDSPNDSDGGLPDQLSGIGGGGSHQASMLEMLKRQQQSQQLALVQQQAQLQAQQLKLQQLQNNAKKARSMPNGSKANMNNNNLSMQANGFMDMADTQVLKMPKNVSSCSSGSMQQHKNANMNAGGLGDPEDENQHLLVPCRARGMPMDHNVKTAHFVVPQNMPHGADLICSYDHCRNAGVKFKFCGVCQMPVAKRNFRNRHKHEDVLGKGSLDNVEGLDDIPAPSFSSKHTQNKPKQESLKNNMNDAINTDNDANFALTASNLHQLQQMQQKQQQLFMNAGLQGSKFDFCANSIKIETKKRDIEEDHSNFSRQEESLQACVEVDTRKTSTPKNHEERSQNSQISTTVRLDKPRDSSQKRSENNFETESNTKGEKRKLLEQDSNEDGEHLHKKFQMWQKLISQRPAPEEGPQKMSQWLLQVLSTSDPKLAAEAKNPVYNDALSRMLVSNNESGSSKSGHQREESANSKTEAQTTSKNSLQSSSKGLSSVTSVSSVASSAATVPTSNGKKKRELVEEDSKKAAAEAMFSLLGGSQSSGVGSDK